MNDLSYPIGTFAPPSEYTAESRASAIREIRDTPALVRQAVRGLTPSQLLTPYRDGGWTVRQVVHHVPESHMNAFVRFKLALTEDNPTIRPYEEDRWVRLGDIPRTPLETSFALLDALHERWVTLLDVMTDADFRRPLTHPQNGPKTLDRMLQLYAWHSHHHLAHITELRRRERW